MGVAQAAVESPPVGVMGVLDDDANQAKAVRLQLEDAGIETVIANLDDIPTIERAIDWVSSQTQALICDVQLNHQHSGIDYNGAALMSTVIDQCGIPGVLTTGFKADVGMLVRPYRHRVPVLVSRDETEETDVLIAGVQICREEIAHGRAPNRETHRVPLYIEKASQADGVALDARVGGWSSKASIRFPATMLGEKFDTMAVAEGIVGRVFFARVNLGAEHESDLFFEDPEPDLVDPADLKLHFEADGQ
jgi:CheY-like chemotaxis protein